MKKAAALGTAAVLTAGMLTGCGDKAETNKNGEEIVELTWYPVSYTHLTLPTIVPV